MALFVGLGLMAAFMLLVLSALLSRVYVRLRYAGSGTQDRLIIVVQALYGAYHKQITIPSLTMRGGQFFVEKMGAGKSSEHGDESRQQDQAGHAHAPMQRSQINHPRLRKLLKKIECMRFRLDFRVGTADAAMTGIVSGLLWGVLGCSIALVEQWLRMRTRPHGAVEPVYRGAEFSVVFESDCRVRVSTLVAALLFGDIRISSLRQSWKSWRQRLLTS